MSTSKLAPATLGIPVTAGIARLSHLSQSVFDFGTRCSSLRSHGDERGACSRGTWLAAAHRIFSLAALLLHTSGLQVIPEQVQGAEATEDVQLTSAANDNAVPELTAPDSTANAASSEAAQDAEPAPMDTAAAEAVPEVAEVPDQLTL